MENHLADITLNQKNLSKLQYRNWYFMLLLEIIRWIATFTA